MEAHQHAAETPPPKRSRLRFSLGTMFVALLVLALVASNLFTSWHLYHARQANRVQQMEIGFLLKELRFLDTSDQENVHIVALETYQELTWKWRIFVPEGKTQALKSMVGELPLGAFPETSRLMWIHPGQRILTCFVSRSANGEWMLTIRTEVDGMVSESTSKIPDEKMAWFTQQGATHTSGVLPISKQQQTISGTNPFGLIWHRKYVGTKLNQRVDTAQPSEGIVFWLEPFEVASPSKSE